MRRLSQLMLAAMISSTLATAALADGNVNTTKPGTVAADDATAASPLNRFAWAGIGYYGAHYSACFNDGELGNVCASSTDGAFGLQVGGAVSFLRLAPGLNLNGWASIAPVFGSFTYFPINLGVGVTYDKLPVQLFGGLGFSVVPNTGQSVAVGLDINLMAIYPLPQVAKGFGAMGQVQFDILDENLFIWNLVVGATYSF